MLFSRKELAMKGISFADSMHSPRHPRLRNDPPRPSQRQESRHKRIALGHHARRAASLPHKLRPTKGKYPSPALPFRLRQRVARHNTASPPHSSRLERSKDSLSIQHGVHVLDTRAVSGAAGARRLREQTQHLAVGRRGVALDLQAMGGRPPRRVQIFLRYPTSRLDLTWAERKLNRSGKVPS